MEHLAGSSEWIKKPGRLSFRAGYEEKTHPEIDDLLVEISDAISDKEIEYQMIVPFGSVRPFDTSFQSSSPLVSSWIDDVTGEDEGDQI